jgi:hypothetical protein
VLAALRLLGRDATSSDQWDAAGYKRAVASGLQRVLIERSLRANWTSGE